MSTKDKKKQEDLDNKLNDLASLFADHANVGSSSPSSSSNKVAAASAAMSAASALSKATSSSDTSKSKTEKGSDKIKAAKSLASAAASASSSSSSKDKKALASSASSALGSLSSVNVATTSHKESTSSKLDVKKGSSGKEGHKSSRREDNSAAKDKLDDLLTKKRSSSGMALADTSSAKALSSSKLGASPSEAGKEKHSSASSSGPLFQPSSAKEKELASLFGGLPSTNVDTSDSSLLHKEAHDSKSSVGLSPTWDDGRQPQQHKQHNRHHEQQQIQKHSSADLGNVAKTYSSDKPALSVPLSTGGKDMAYGAAHPSAPSSTRSAYDPRNVARAKTYEHNTTNAENKLRDLFQDYSVDTPLSASHRSTSGSTKSSSIAADFALLMEATSQSPSLPRQSSSSTRTHQRSLSKSTPTVDSWVPSVSSTAAADAAAFDSYSNALLLHQSPAMPSSASGDSYASPAIAWYTIEESTGDDLPMEEDRFKKQVDDQVSNMESIYKPLNDTTKIVQKLVYRIVLESRSSTLSVWCSLVYLAKNSMPISIVFPALAELVADDGSRSATRIRLSALAARYFTLPEACCGQLRALYCIHFLLLLMPGYALDASSSQIISLKSELTEIATTAGSKSRRTSYPRRTDADGKINLHHILSHYCMLVLHKMELLTKYRQLEGNYSLQSFLRRASIMKHVDKNAAANDSSMYNRLLTDNVAHSLAKILAHCALLLSLISNNDMGRKINGGTAGFRNNAAGFNDGLASRNGSIKAHFAIFRALIVMEAAYARCLLNYIVYQRKNRAEGNQDMARKVAPLSMEQDLDQDYHEDHGVGIDYTQNSFEAQFEKLCSQCTSLATKGYELISAKALVRSSKSEVRLEAPPSMALGDVPKLANSVQLHTKGLLLNFNSFDDIHESLRYQLKL